VGAISPLRIIQNIIFRYDRGSKSGRSAAADFMNINMKQVLVIVRVDAYRFVVEFLMDNFGM